MDNSILQKLLRFQKTTDFQQLVDIAAELIGNPVVLFDMNERVIACTQAPVEDTQFQELQHGDLSSGKMIKNLDWMRTIRRLYTRDYAEIEEFNNLHMLTRGLCVNGVAVGHLHSTSYYRPFTHDDVAIVELLVPRLALALYQHLCLDSAQQSELDTFLHYLLFGHTLSPASAELKCHLLGWTPGKVLYVLCVNLLSVGSDQHAIASSLLCGPDDRYTSFDNHAVIILSRTTPMDDDEFSQTATYFSTLGTFCGMSRAFSSVCDLAAQYEQAKAACDIGSRVFPRQFMFRYDDCLPWVFIRKQAETEDVLHYVMPGLLKLADEDQHTGSALLHTLWLYLDCDRSIKLVADKLNVHKNTVSFRLNKITDALGLELADRDLRRLLHSVSIMEYVDKKRFFGV